MGIVADCMADCRIEKLLPKVPGESLSYEASAVTIHHPSPSESFFGKNPRFKVRERSILVKLRGGKGT